MIRSCDKLKALLCDTKEETGKKKKTFIGMTIYFAWAGSPTSLAQRACRIVIFDEANKYQVFSGKEAAPIKLGKERTNTFKYTKKIVYLSTPTNEMGVVTVGEKDCEARFRYRIACPHCGHRQPFNLAGIKYPAEEKTRRVIGETPW